ncbi:MAG: NYN domain-containing protein [Candidatus Aenigmarchaeota archaeon]|nr:NYN domain-containing protein [Candidatus Aenigmarchaeota archaeon]MDW8149430.1 NYN domain-containing protein [Candidatus Aenigmarchaeota archaeon]
MKVKKRNVAIYIDGPNFLRKEYNIDLSEIMRIGKKYGKITIAKVFVNQFAPQKLIEAILNEGFECLTFLAEREDADIDVPLAIDALETALTKDVDVFILCTKDTDFFSLVKKIKERGKIVVIVGVENIPSSLKNSADYIEIL